MRKARQRRGRSQARLIAQSLRDLTWRVWKLHNPSEFVPRQRRRAAIPAHRTLIARGSLKVRCAPRYSGSLQGTVNMQTSDCSNLRKVLWWKLQVADEGRAHGNQAKTHRNGEEIWGPLQRVPRSALLGNFPFKKMDLHLHWAFQER